MRMRDIIMPHSRLRRFARSEDGAALVEFAMVLPMMLLVFAIIIEGGRMLISYQSAIAGVRDATRYLSRVAPSNACTAGAVAGHTGKLTSIVTTTVANTPVFDSSVTINSVTPSSAPGTGTYRVSPVCVASVTANVTIDFPLGSVFGIFGVSIPSVTTNVADSARIYGT